MPSIFKPMLHLAAHMARCLSFALLPALSSEALAGAAAPHASLQRTTLLPARRVSVPYLALVGSPGLRMEMPASEIPPEPKPPEPPKPVPPAVEPKPAPAEPALAPKKEEPPPLIPDPQPEIKPTVDPEPQYPRGEKPVSILPDDTIRELNPDEVLPFFRYPATAPEPDRPPTPENLPRSSATYRLQ
ncbi:MAG: hypothetical protein SFV32_03765 [Opitutaceae bacterium]|nr:hypothetical protein [Opitutaceae bacterium]